MSKPVAHVINLTRRADRWANMQQRWSSYFTLKRIEAVDMPGRGADGCKASHVGWAEVLLRSESMVVIMEDDCVATPAMETIGLACIEEARELIDQWDWINGGAFTDLSKIGLPRAELSPSPSRLFLRASYVHNTSFCLYNKRSLPFLLSSLDNPVPIDMHLARSVPEKWIPIRLLATQDGSESDIRRPFPGQHQFYDLTRQMLEQYES